MAKVMVHLDNITKRFDRNLIIKKTSLDIYEGEFLTLLGPSGCGKTTILRMISGLDKPTTGRVFIDDVDVTNLDAANREVNTIFQNFALFPHMTTYDNIAFGLRMRKEKKKDIDEKVKQAIKLVNLSGFEDRLPSELSGGQQQRVAIARGIVMNPKVLLLDESLCSLDLKLKKKMQIELKKLQKKLGITFIYVTHDQDEALTMSDRIAIINKGLIEQLDTPQNIYRSPNTVFVADFIGESNILEARVTEVGTSAKVKVEDLFELVIKNDDYKVKDELKLVIRPEIVDVYKKNARGRIKGIITDLIYDGNVTKLEVQVEDKELKVEVFNSAGYKIGQEVFLGIEKEYIIAIKR